MKNIDKLKIEPLPNYILTDFLFFYKSNIYFEISTLGNNFFCIKKNGPKLCSLKFEVNLNNSFFSQLIYVDYDEKRNKINGFVIKTIENYEQDQRRLIDYASNYARNRKYRIIYFKRKKEIKTISFKETYNTYWFGVFKSLLLIQNKHHDVILFNPETNQFSLDLLFEKPDYKGIRYFAINHCENQVLLFGDRYCLCTKIDNQKFVVLNTIKFPKDVISQCSFNKINGNVYSFISMFDQKKTSNIKIAAIVNQNSLQMLNPSLKSAFNLISYQFNPVEMKKVLQKWISINDLLYIVFSYIV